MEQTPTNETPKAEWKGFCCSISTFPGWTHGMAKELLGRALCCCCYCEDGGEDEDDSFCGVENRSISFPTTGYDGKKGSLELDHWSFCGLCASSETKGLAESRQLSFSCCLGSSSRGKNSASEFWAFHLLGTGCVCAKGEHSGCGVGVGFFEAFWGSAVRKCTCFLWESGCDTY